MAYETVAVVQAAVTSIYNAVAQRKTLPRGRSAVAALNEIRQAIVEAYVTDVSVLISAAETIANAFLSTGVVGLALGRDAVAGDTFTNTGTADFSTGTPLVTAKGGALAIGDRFEVLSASTVAFIGTSTDVEMDDETVNDFAVKAGS
jgi:hypothetical protein